MASVDSSKITKKYLVIGVNQAAADQDPSNPDSNYGSTICWHIHDSFADAVAEADAANGNALYSADSFGVVEYYEVSRA